MNRIVRLAPARANRRQDGPVRLNSRFRRRGREAGVGGVGGRFGPNFGDLSAPPAALRIAHSTSPGRGDGHARPAISAIAYDHSHCGATAATRTVGAAHSHPDRRQDRHFTVCIDHCAHTSPMLPHRSREQRTAPASTRLGVEPPRTAPAFAGRDRSRRPTRRHRSTSAHPERSASADNRVPGAAGQRRRSCRPAGAVASARRGRPHRRLTGEGPPERAGELPAGSRRSGAGGRGRGRRPGRKGRGFSPRGPRSARPWARRGRAAPARRVKKAARTAQAGREAPTVAALRSAALASLRMTTVRRPGLALGARAGRTSRAGDGARRR
ncbi:hypothetical protein SAMN02745121_05332 [Nannocystis exedens]|uniref:Uncharacterized protein n=1 Tax=Nannocystis exedens TaxID=54 RepID=A0A1I2CYB2_9BACT|nr:hypothetical protein NAEX_01673 [Nannocystis exedens]SFE73212.1 hypothetical protein SAMN02745121_05332 [Nannocystis exedens]